MSKIVFETYLTKENFVQERGKTYVSYIRKCKSLSVNSKILHLNKTEKSLTNCPYIFICVLERGLVYLYQGLLYIWTDFLPKQVAQIGPKIYIIVLKDHYN